MVKSAYNPKNVSMMEKRKRGLRSAGTGGFRSQTPTGGGTQTLLGFNTSAPKLDNIKIPASEAGTGNRIMESKKLRVQFERSTSAKLFESETLRKKNLLI
jgi:hypothetical protein